MKTAGSRAFTMVAALATHGVSTDERLARLEALDLTNVKRKLMEPYPEGKGWSQNQVDEAEKWYKRYLATIIKYPDATQHVPNGPIDFFWHQHILDTMAYGPDCQYVLGYFLHHYPYFGLNGDAAERDTSFDETNDLYIAMYGEPCTSMKTFQINDGKSDIVRNCGDVNRTSKNGATCGVGCHPDRALVEIGSNCNHGGSGTGCGQGGGKGR